MAEWLKAADCKSVLERVQWFESISAHQIYGIDKIQKKIYYKICKGIKDINTDKLIIK